jgi:hypothetical protein
VHGDYGPSGPAEGQIHFDRLEAIDKQINKRVLVALHGTNDFPPEVMQRCIRAGAIKLNVNKLLLEVGNEVLRKNAASTPLVKLIDLQMEAIQRETERWMDSLFLSRSKLVCVIQTKALGSFSCTVTLKASAYLRTPSSFSPVRRLAAHSALLHHHSNTTAPGQRAVHNPTQHCIPPHRLHRLSLPHQRRQHAGHAQTVP